MTRGQLLAVSTVVLMALFGATLWLVTQTG